MKRMRAIFILAKLNASEWIRLKFFHVIIFFGILFIGFSHLLSSLTFSVQERLLYDFGLAGLEIGIVVIASLIGTHSIHREIDRKTLFVLLARPIPRSYIILGAWISILVLCFLFTVGFLGSLVVSSGYIGYGTALAIAALSSFLKIMVISSFAICMSLLVRPMLAFGATLSYWLFSYSLPDIKYFILKLKDDSLMNVYSLLEKIMPQFHLYNWKSFYYMKNMPSYSDVLWAVFHSLAWSLVWLFLACLFFRRKEIV